MMLYIYSVDNDKHLNGDNKMTRKAKYIKAINKLEEAKKLLNLDYIIIAMSGSKEARKEWEELGNHHNYFLDKNEIINKDGQPLTEIIRNHYKDIDFN